jgi:transposase InsO family protein
MVSPARRREAVDRLQTQFDTSERRTCRVIEQPRSTQRYRSAVKSDEVALIQRMHALVRCHPRYGYRRVWAMLRADGWRVNRKRVYRLWRREGFKVPRKQRKKRRLGSSANGIVRHRPEHKDHVWAWDFIHDRDERGRPLKWFALMDEYTRECLALEVERSIKAVDVIDILSQVFLIRSVPRHIRSDNGPEFIAQAIRRYLETAKVNALYIEPGAPWENGYAESFFSRLRDEFLNCELFTDLREAKQLGGDWLAGYNHHRPHSSLDYRTPAAFAAECRTDPGGSAPRPPASFPSRLEEQKLQGVCHDNMDPTLITTGT